MALAYGSFNELSHQLRFLLFEIGIGLHQQQIEYYITVAHRKCLQTVQQLAIKEGFISAPLTSHHIHDFLEQLQHRLKTTHPASRFFSWNKLYFHCNETIANNALAYAYKKSWNNRLSRELQQYSNLWAWLQEQSADHAFRFLAQWGCDSPTIETSWNKTRDYTRREVLQYSSVFQAQFSIHWMALSKKEALIAPGFEQLMKREFTKEYFAWQEKLRLHHVQTQDYSPLPVHPWMWRTMQTAYAPMLDNKSLILLPHHQSVTPAMSSNTLMGLNSKTHLKITAENERSLLKKLYHSLAKENYYDNTLFIIKSGETHVTNTQSLQQAKPLGISLLPSPSSFVNQQQKVIPLLSLFTPSPLTHTCLIDELIQKSTLSPLAFFIHYCQKIMFAPLHLFLKYRWSFTTAPEDTFVIVSDHLPQGLILGEIQYLSMQENLIEHLNQSVLQNNIQYLITYLSQHYPIDSNYLRSQVWQILEDTISKQGKAFDLDLLKEQYPLLFTQVGKNPSILSKYLTPNAPH
jgi:hypothetical protein